MHKVALEGDWQDCPQSEHHGGIVVVDDPDRPKVNGRRIALVGDKCICAGGGMAVIVTGSHTSFVKGRAVAIIGSKTDHGGTIVRSGDGACELD